MRQQQRKGGPITGGEVSRQLPPYALTDHPPPAELVVARGLFASPSPAVTDDLYAKVVEGRAERRRRSIVLEAGAAVTTNTYFGLLPASYFQRWTDTAHVGLKLAYTTSGRARISLRASNFRGANRTIDSVCVVGAGGATMSAPLDAFVDGGSLWLECEAIDGSLTVTDLLWTTSAPATIRPAALVICTYNRPDACADTLLAVAGDADVLAGIDAVYVVDQSNDPIADLPAVAEAMGRLGDKGVYVRQRNLGGSGGFTRGLYEVSRLSDHANVILMDDDIICEPETVLRLNAFANLAPTPTIVGAQMLFEKNPRYLLAGAEMADLATLRGGRWGVHGLHSADVAAQRQDRRVDGTYTAWWTCLIPAEVIATVGLPLPYFIRWDDIEFGLRAGAAGFATVTLANAAVWHAEFHWKDTDDWVRYFDVRNALITAALRDQLHVETTIRMLRWEIATQLVSMQYGLASTVIHAIDDFLHGPSVLEDGGTAAMDRIRAERSKFAETTVHPAVRTADLVNTPNPSTKPTDPKRKRLDLLLVKRLLSHASGRLIPGPVTIPAADATWWHVSRFNEAVVTDASQTGVRIRRHDPAAFRRLGLRALRTLRRLRTEAPAVQHSYRAALPRLSGRANWERLFGEDTAPHR